MYHTPAVAEEFQFYRNGVRGYGAGQPFAPFNKRNAPAIEELLPPQGAKVIVPLQTVCVNMIEGQYSRIFGNNGIGGTGNFLGNAQTTGYALGKTGLSRSQTAAKGDNAARRQERGYPFPQGNGFFRGSGVNHSCCRIQGSILAIIKDDGINTVHGLPGDLDKLDMHNRIGALVDP
jgi:hypothetical protein